MMIIMGMTWKEMMRKRVMLLTLIMTVIFLIAFWFIAKTIGGIHLTSRFDPNSTEVLIDRFMRGSFILMLGFFFGAFVVAFLSIFSSFAVISGEAEQGVMQSLLPRPLPRWKWYLGRWLGYVTLGMLYALILFIAILLITNAQATIPKDPASLIKSFLLFASVVPLLITASMWGSGFFSAVGNGVFMTMLYGAGWLGGMIEKVSSTIRLDAALAQPLNNISGIMSLLMPADALQRKMLAELFSFKDLGGLMSSQNSPLGMFDMGQIPSSTFIMYTVIYTLVLFVWGMRRFGKKDF
ncbi:ABC transporter permease [Paenibacillus selenitireducens]|uniref:ABC transporter permease n=1 Tax=Paenibacillus selenitireducens TaxID=1324314 RepID=A0A1T2X609_9BACL|nr:ABC transporter permease subunit [Paenibacillus selenitireducens]OPA75317.1 ABC transporter permease [Paenibacillus selenitireducens]